MGIEICSIRIAFWLPDWTSDEQFDEEIPVLYGMGHAYEGQLEKYRQNNVLLEGLFGLSIPPDIASVEETCLMNTYESVTVSFNCDLKELPRYVEIFQKQLERFLGNIERKEL